MSNTSENLTAARDAIAAAYDAHKGLESETDVHGAFRMLTREARRITLPVKGLGAERRASRLVRARGLVAAAKRVTEDGNVHAFLAQADSFLSEVAVSTPDADSVESFPEV